MNTSEDFGPALKRLRTSAGLTQTALSTVLLDPAKVGTEHARRLLERCRRRVSDLEAGRGLPSEEEIAALASRLGPSALDELTPTFRRVPREDPWADERKDIAKRFSAGAPRPLKSLVNARKRHRAGYAIAKGTARNLDWRIRRRAHADHLERFLLSLPIETGGESLLVKHVAAGASVPVVLSVRRLGFRQHAVVDRETGEHIGDIPVPGFWIRLGPLELIVFCQVTVRPILTDYRPDFLVVVLVRGMKLWFVVEADGTEKPDDAYQRKRQDELNLPLLRFRSHDLERMDFLKLLKDTIVEQVLPPAVRADLMRAAQDAESAPPPARSAAASSVPSGAPSPKRSPTGSSAPRNPNNGRRVR